MPGDEETRRSGAEFPWLFDPPPTPREDDAAGWFNGPCVLFCRGSLTRVFYAGTIEVPGARVAAQICESCARELQQVVLDVKSDPTIRRVAWPPPGLEL